ncbi:MAG: hypothetical protein KDB51_11160, partial [Propionibacteriaceae bacterium]|nr:hypothetical protein [Propionibacteriaceae bacterium]
GGDARLIGNRLGGYGAVASHAGVVLAAGNRLGTASTEADDDRVRKERKDLKVSAMLHTSYP